MRSKARLLVPFIGVICFFFAATNAGAQRTPVVDTEKTNDEPNDQR